MTYHARFWAIKQNFVRSNSVLVKRIAKEMCNMRVFVHEMWAPVVMHKVHNAYGLHPDRQNTRFLRFFALFGAQKPNSGVEIFPKKKIFFLRFFAGRSLSPSFFLNRGEMPKNPKILHFY